MITTAVIPAKNEQDNIADVIAGCLRVTDSVLVIDGNSSDKTVEVAKSAGAKVVKQTSRGKGGAIVESLEHVKAGIILFIDADQSHDPADIPALIQPIKLGHADLVIGSRMRGGSDELFTGIREFIRLIGSHIITLAIAKRFKVPFTDSQNGFRAISVECLKALDLRQSTFTIETEMCIESMRSGFRVMEIPTHEYRRKFGTSNINPLKLGPLYVWVAFSGVMKPRKKPARWVKDEDLQFHYKTWNR